MVPIWKLCAESAATRLGEPARLIHLFRCKPFVSLTCVWFCYGGVLVWLWSRMDRVKRECRNTSPSTILTDVNDVCVSLWQVIDTRCRHKMPVVVDDSYRITRIRTRAAHAYVPWQPLLLLWSLKRSHHLFRVVYLFFMVAEPRSGSTRYWNRKERQRQHSSPASAARSISWQQRQQQTQQQQRQQHLKHY